MTRLPMFLIAALLAGDALPAQEARARWEALNNIRRQKFELILPGALRDNGVDMWIHVIRDGDPDALALDLGGDLGIFVFTDRGGDRIERAVLGGTREGFDEAAYDIIGSREDLAAHVAERDPKRIAVNTSAWLAVADGLSHSGYAELMEMLGEKYAARVVSAEQVITDFRVRRVQAEIVAFANAAEMTRQIMEAALSNDVITPGVTTLGDVGWWVQDQLMARNLGSSFGVSRPYVLYSAESPDARFDSDYAIQRGDFLAYDMGVEYLNFGTDFKRHAYVLREGERAVPAPIQHAWDRGLEARRIVRTSIRVGRTAGETLAAAAEALEAEGFVYTPFTDTWEQDRKIVAALGDSEQTGVQIDCHTVGNTGNSEVAVGPSFAPFRPGRAHVMVQPNNIFSLELVAHTAIPTLRERRLVINFEDNAIVTAHGVEFLYPPNERIRVIR